MKNVLWTRQPCGKTLLAIRRRLMKIFQSLTILLLLFLLALVLASWEFWCREANAPAVEKTTLREKLGMITKPTSPASENIARGILNENKNKRIVCWKCQGLGKVVIQRSDKYTTYTCPICAGRGGRELSSLREICELCKGMGKVIVPEAGGPHPGKREIDQNRLMVSAQTCPLCIGEGITLRYKE